MLNCEELIGLISQKNLIEGYINLEIQLTPNGFDLTVGQIFKFDACGKLDFSNSERVIPKGKEIIPTKNKPGDKFGWWHLESGAYKVRTNEVVNLPNDLMAIAFPRSSLLRMGAYVHNGVWDAGFRGKSEFILVVGNPSGIKIKQNARLIQIIFSKITQTRQSYQGIYQNLR